jgi:SAM-dependent methyltransferase
VAQQDRERWNRRYRERYEARDYRWEPSRWLAEIAADLTAPIPGARALDLACGGGRNAVWLAERGWSVDAWDLSDVGLDILRRKLAEHEEAGSRLDIRPRQVDLDQATVPADSYDLIVNMLFLDRRLWSSMAAGLCPGGRLLFETFLDVGPGSRPSVRPEHLLAPGELARAFGALGLETLTFDEDADRATARLLARHP